MDIGKIKPVERVIEIHHPADETQLLGIRISLLSINDPIMTKIKRKIQDEKSRLDQRAKILTAERIEENANEILFTAMTGWHWYNPTGKAGDEGYNADADANFKGKKPEFNRNSVLAVLNEEGMDWFGTQISAAISDEKSFFTKSETN